MCNRFRSFLRSADGTFTELAAVVTPPPDPDYIEGAIEFVVGGVEIVGQGEWDYVDQLWAYIATMVWTLRTDDTASTYFPDQPIQLVFERVGEQIVVRSRIGEVTRRSSAGESEFIEAVRAAGQAFFERMTVLAPANSAPYQVALSELAG